MAIEVTDSAAGALVQALTWVTGTKAASGDNELIAAPGAGNRLVVKILRIQNESSTATTIILKDGSTAKMRALLQNQADELAHDFEGRFVWRLSENAALNLNLDGANSHGYTCAYWVEAVE